MKVYVIGTRGFPNVQGGVEKHCESLYPLIAQMGIEVKVSRRSPYIHEQHREKCSPHVRFHDLWTLKTKSFEAILHSILASLFCLVKRPNIVHVHDIGPGVVLPLLKLGGLCTVVTYHSPNYAHTKWGPIAKKILKLAELLVMRLADQIIFVSNYQKKLFGGNNRTYIPNGVIIPIPSSKSDFLSRIGAEPSKYILAVGRFTPEKGLHVLIRAFQGIGGETAGW